MIRGKWKTVSPRGIRAVGGSKRINIKAVRWVFILESPSVLSVLARANRINW